VPYPDYDKAIFGSATTNHVYPQSHVHFLIERVSLRTRCTLRLNYKPFEFLPQASQILSGLYISDIYTATSPLMLDALGITHILSLYPEHFDFGHRFKSLWLPVHSPESEDDLLQLLPTTSYFLKGALAGEAVRQAKILVCCPYGIQDSPAIVIGYLIAEQRMRLKDALRSVREARPVVELAPNSRRQLEEWEERTKGSLERELEFRTRELRAEREGSVRVGIVRCASRMKIPTLVPRTHSSGSAID